MESASRIPPSAAAAIKEAAPSVTVNPSFPAIYCILSQIRSGSILLKSNRWQRESIVAGSL